MQASQNGKIKKQWKEAPASGKEVTMRNFIIS